MVISSIKLLNFRNHLEKKVDFDRINFISGDNGAGKTAIAEAVNVILTLKSFRQNNFKKIVNFNKDFFYLYGKILQEDFEVDVKFKYHKKKELFVNDKREKFLNYIKNNIVLFYSPENEGILSNNQRDRRGFLDRVIFYRDNFYIEKLREYNRLFVIKKAILEKKHIDLDYLKVINSKLLELSSEISKIRMSIVEKLNVILFSKFNDFNIQERFKIVFFTKAFENGIFHKELKYRKVLFGCHLDKIYFTLNEVLSDGIASFGQRKTFALLTIASILISIEELIKNDIIIILDDFEVGLDGKRIEAFKSIFDKYQLVITGVKNNYFKEANNILI